MKEHLNGGCRVAPDSWLIFTTSHSGEHSACRRRTGKHQRGLIAERYQALIVATVRCKTRSFYAQGIKVRSGEAHILIDGAWRRVVLTTPGEDEVHVRELPDGASVSLPDGLMLQVWQDRLFGKKGRHVDLEHEIGGFVYRRHETLYLKRLLQHNNDEAILKKVLERGWVSTTNSMIGFLKRNSAVAQRVHDEMRANGASTTTLSILMHGITDEETLVAGTRNVLSAHVALPRLAETAPLERVLDAVDGALELFGGRTVSQWCHSLSAHVLEAVVLRSLQRIESVSGAERVSLEEELELFLTGSLDAYRVETSVAITRVASRLIESGTVMPEGVMRKRGRLRAKSEERVETPTGVWKRVADQTENGARRVMTRRGRVACVAELPLDSEELVELLNHEDVAVRRAALERLDDPVLWRSALADTQWRGYMAERAPLSALLAHVAETSAAGPVLRVAQERGCQGVDEAEMLTCSELGLHTAQTSSDENALAAVLSAAVAAERGTPNGDWMMPVRIIDAVVSRTRDQAQLKWLREVLSTRDNTRFYTINIEKRLRELELSDLVWQAKRDGELLIARGAMSQMEAHDLLWEMNGDPELGRWAGARLIETLVVPEPF